MYKMKKLAGRSTISGCSRIFLPVSRNCIQSHTETGMCRPYSSHNHYCKPQTNRNRGNCELLEDTHNHVHVLVAGFKPIENMKVNWVIIPNKWESKKCPKPPTSVYVSSVTSWKDILALKKMCRLRFTVACSKKEPPKKNIENPVCCL